MRSKLHTAVILCTCLLVALVSCTRDPNARKQKYLESGNRYLEAGKTREAGIEFANAVKIDPAFADAHYGMSKVYTKLGSYQNAYIELSRTVDLDPNNFKAQIDLAKLLLAAARQNPDFVDQARKKAELVLSKDPNNAQAYYILSNAAALQGKPQEALAQIDKAISLAPHDAEFQLNKAVVQESQKDFASAEATFRAALLIDPKSAVAYDMLANMYRMQQRWPDVENTFRTAITEIPNSLPLRMEFAQFYDSPGQNKKEQAQQVLEDAKKMVGTNATGRRMIAEFEYTSDNTEEAFRDFAAILNDNPKDFVAKGRYAELLLQKNRDDEANRQISELLKASPNDVMGRIVKGQILIKNEKFADALSLLQAVVKDEPKNAVAHYYLGIAYQSAGENDQAESEWREAVGLDATLLPAYRALATLAKSKADLDLMQTAANGILTNDPTSSEGFLLKANIDLGHKNPAAAEQDINRAIEVAPNNPDSYSALAEFRLQQKRVPDAVGLYEKALAVAPSAVGPIQGLVAIYISQKQPDKAKARLKEQIAKSPGTAAFYAMLATMQARSKDYAAAEQTLKEGMALDSSNPSNYILLAQIQGAIGNVDQAIAAYQSYIQRNPRDVIAYLSIASLEESRNNPQAARQMYQKALSVDPNSPAANNNLAYMILQSGGDVDVAISMAQAALRRVPDSPNIADTLGYAYIKKGVYSSAVELLESASKKDPNSVSIHYHLGLAYSKLNSRSKARENFLKATQLGPQTADGLAAKKELQAVGS